MFSRRLSACFLQSDRVEKCKTGTTVECVTLWASQTDEAVVLTCRVEQQPPRRKGYAGDHFGQPEGRHGEIDLMHRSGGRRHGGWRACLHNGDRSPGHDLELGGASN